MTYWYFIFISLFYKMYIVLYSYSYICLNNRSQGFCIIDALLILHAAISAPTSALSCNSNDLKITFFLSYPCSDTHTQKL